jgi:catalase
MHKGGGNERPRARAQIEALRTNQGVKIADNQNTLRAGSRGPSLLEDFIAREKITRFDHERIPERIVHARGSAANGVFQLYESMGIRSRRQQHAHVLHSGCDQVS